MNEEGFEHIVYSRNVLEFVTVANEFCHFTESIDAHQRKEFVHKTQKVLTLLYLKASMLPQVEDLLEETPEKFVSEDDYNYLQRKITTKMGEFDTYQEVFDPDMQYSDAPIAASLAENITDIYQDLKDFTLAYRIGTLEVMNDALFECQQNFEHYWGQKLVNALRALHALIYGDVNLDEASHTPTSQKDENGHEDNILKQHFNHYKNETDQQ